MSEVLPHCILIKGNYLQGHFWATFLSLEDTAEFAHFDMICPG